VTRSPFIPLRHPRRAVLGGWLTVLWLSAAAASAAAQSDAEMPRYDSLQADEVNLRTGPGVRYPIEWVFQRRGLPVEVIQSFDTWRKIRDWEGTEGWVHQTMLWGQRFAVVVGELRTLRREPAPDAAPVAHVEPGVIGELLHCAAGEAWCRMQIAGHEGWLKRNEIWGVYPDEAVE
jgi:SH3-like domain-containing protein